MPRKRALGPCLVGLLAGLFAGLGGLFLACAGDEGPKHGPFGELWQEYRALPDERALATAGDLTRTRWVAGASGGHASSEEAKEAALAECLERRSRRRLQAKCRVYAIGDEILPPDSSEPSDRNVLMESAEP